MANSQLLQYIKQQTQQGAREQEIKETLLANGWSDIEISETLMISKINSAPVSPVLEAQNQEKVVLASEKVLILDKVKKLASYKLITREDVVSAYNEGSGTKGSAEKIAHKINISEILYYLGGAIVFLGITILVGQNWEKLNTVTKIIATLGGGIAAYVTGVLLGHSKLDRVEQAFFLLSALLLPLGLFTTFDSAGINMEGAGVNSVIFGLLFLFYLASSFLFKKDLFTFFSILFGTIFYFAITSFIAGPVSRFNEEKFFEYRILLIGLSYILLGYGMAKSSQNFMARILYSFGLIGFLGSALALGGWKPNQNAFWEIIFPGIVFSVIFLSTYIKSKTFLVFGSFFLMLYILKITGEYFKDSLGWPLALVLAGFALIGVGYLSVYLNKKYITT